MNKSVSSNKNSGFTIVELLIVLIVIIILGVLVISSYNGIRAKDRNAKRQDRVIALQHQLEGFFSQNGYYPSSHDMNSPSWLAENMKGLDQTDLIDPSNSQNSKQLATTPTPKSLSYQVTDSSGVKCEQTDTNCAKYTITAIYEGTVNGKSQFVKSSMN